MFRNNWQVGKNIQNNTVLPESRKLRLTGASILNPASRCKCKYHRTYSYEVVCSYKRFHGPKMAVRQTSACFYFLLFRAVTATTMVISTTLATTVTGGVLLRTIVITHGTGT